MLYRLARYAREPIWTFSRAAGLGDAGALLLATARHHVANWTKAPPRGDLHVDLSLALGGDTPSTVRVRPIGGDISILFEVFAERAYDIPEAALPSDGVEIVVDCGAHVGFSALYFAHRYRRARVIAVEPNPANYALLCRNVANTPRITPVQACIGDRSGETHITVDGPSWSFRASKEGAPVPAMTLRDLRERYGFERIDLLKMDTEGAEQAVIESGIGEVRALALELHGDYTREALAQDLPLHTLTGRNGADTIFALGPAQRREAV